MYSIRVIILLSFSTMVNSNCETLAKLFEKETAQLMKNSPKL